MAKCKLSNCREEAVTFAAKRYCPAHLAEYKRKQREFLAVRATLRCCETCGEKLTKTGNDNGDTLCRSCQTEARTKRLAELKQRQFDSAETVEALKDWMRKYLL